MSQDFLMTRSVQRGLGGGWKMPSGALGIPLLEPKKENQAGWPGETSAHYRHAADKVLGSHERGASKGERFPWHIVNCFEVAFAYLLPSAALVERYRFDGLGVLKVGDVEVIEGNVAIFSDAQEAGDDGSLEQQATIPLALGGPAHVYCYKGEKRWRDCGKIGHGIRIFCLASFKGDLYAGDDSGKCYRWDGGTNWIFAGQLGREHRLNSMTIWRGNLYGSSHGSIFRYEGGTNWTLTGKNPYNCNQIHKIQVYNGELIAGTWPYGTVMRYEGEYKWTRMGDLGIATDKYQINEINDLRVYNGKLYAGVIPLAEVYRHESQTKWILLRRMVNSAYWSEADDHSGWRVPAMTVFQGKLFHGTSTCHGNADPMHPAEAGRI